MDELSYNYPPAFLTRYLLGDLLPEEQDSLEEKFFLDNSLFTNLLDIKDQLISNYLGGRLSSDDSKRFEERFLTSPECRQEVELASLLRSAIAEPSVTTALAPTRERNSPWREFFMALHARQALAGSLAAAMLIVVVASSWFAMRSGPEATQTASSGTSVFTLELSSGQQRDLNQLPQVPLSSGVQTVALKLDAGTDEYSDYHAKLFRLAEGATSALSSKKLKQEKNSSGGKIVLWEIPAASLQSGDYQVKLEALNADGSTENIGSYFFAVAW